MSHVDPDLALDYISAFLQFQDEASGHLCSMIGPPSGLVGGKCSADASVPSTLQLNKMGVNSASLAHLHDATLERGGLA